MSILNLWDPQEKKYVSVRPILEHILPEENDLLCFEAYDERVRDFHTDRLTLTDFKVSQYKGFIVGVRTTLRAPRGIYLGIDKFKTDIFKQFQDVATPPATLPPHPLLYVIPSGLPGSGSIVVRNVAGLRSNGEVLTGLKHVEREAKERTLARQALLALGFTLKEE